MPNKRKRVSDQQIADAIRESRGNVAKAGRLLGMSPGALPARFNRSDALGDYVKQVKAACVVPLDQIPVFSAPSTDVAPAAASHEPAPTQAAYAAPPPQA